MYRGLGLSIINVITFITGPNVNIFFWVNVSCIYLVVTLFYVRYSGQRAY